MTEGASYERAGVSLEKADTFLEAMLRWVRRTEDIPGSAARMMVPNGYYASVLDCGLDVAVAMSTDGVGTKILVAEMAGDFSSVGIDCIAMNVNDLICVGASPIAMIDYLAIQDPPPEVGDQIGKSLYEGARLAGISIPGGELAQLPEMIRGIEENQGVDLAGAAFGLVNKADVDYGQRLRPGDVLLGIASNGVHSNGFTLVRDLCFRQAGLKVTDTVAELGHTVGEELLRPTAIYVPHLRLLRERGLAPRAALHITGGGFLNLLRVATDNVTFVVDQPPAMPPVFQWLQQLGNVSAAEMHRVFNMGVGMVLVVAPEHESATLEALADVAEPRLDAWRIGHVEAGNGRAVHLPRRGLIGRGSTFESS